MRRGFPFGRTSRRGIRARLHRPRGGFTLLEIVLVLAIIAILAVVSIPAVKGIQDGVRARRPLVELAKMAQSARLRALEEGRPYQVIFSDAGFRATRYFDPYAEQFDVEAFFAELERDELERQNGGGVSDPNDENALPARPELALSYELPEGVTLEVQRWGEPLPMPLTDGRLHSWVFQPSGLCNPVRVRFGEGEGYHEAFFNTLTADIDHERYYVP